MLKQRVTSETFLRGVMVFLVLNLIAIPIVENVLLAQSLAEGPIISHLPSRVARYGNKLTIRAHVASDAQLKKVNVVLLNGDKPLRGSLPIISQSSTVPVRVMTTSNTILKSKSDESGKMRAMVPAGQILHVSGVSNNHYRAMTEEGKKGYIKSEHAEVLNSGLAFGVTLPPELTKRSRFIYQIEAIDSRGNITTTEPITIRLLTTEEIKQLLAMIRDGKTPTTPTSQKALYKKPSFWGGVAVAGGLAYLLLNDNGDDDQEQATLDVSITWE